MAKFKITEFESRKLKAEIMRDTRLDDFGNYACGCAINPKFSTINKLCNKHKDWIREQ